MTVANRNWALRSAVEGFHLAFGLELTARLVIVRVSIFNIDCSYSTHNVRQIPPYMNAKGPSS